MIEILPESKGNLVAAKASAKLTQDDYEEVWVPALRKAIKEHGKVRSLLYLDETFQGWEAGALWEDAKLGFQNRDDFEKVAVVGGAQWVEMAVKLIAPLMEGAVKTFPTGSLQEAYDWIQ
jgi:hypothetical protein